MKKLLFILLMSTFFVNAQTNVGEDEGRYHFDDTLSISSNSFDAFDGDWNSAAYLYAANHAGKLGVIFWNPVDIDSITFNYTANKSCGRYVYIEIDRMNSKAPPYSWKSEWTSLGYFINTCTLDAITVPLSWQNCGGIRLRFTMPGTSELELAHIGIVELEIWGNRSLITSVSDIKTKSKEVEMVYDLMGREIAFRVERERVLIEKSGIAIIRYSDGSTEKRITNKF